MGKWADFEYDKEKEARKDRVWFYSWLIPFTVAGTLFMRWLAKVFFRTEKGDKG